MLKRLIALTLALLLTAGFALAEENLQYDGLLDKLIDQLQRSGMRGIFRLTVEGDSDLALQLRPLSGAMIQFRALAAEDGPESDHRSEFTLYAEKDGVRTAELDRDERHHRLPQPGERKSVREVVEREPPQRRAALGGSERTGEDHGATRRNTRT